MSTQSPWRPSYSRNPDEPIEIHEELDSPPRRRWPMVVVAVVALLVGLGIGNMFGTTSRDLRDAEGQIDSATAALQVTERQRDRAEARADALRQDKATEATARTVAEEGLEATAHRLAILAGHPVGQGLSNRHGTLVTGLVDAATARDLAAVRRLSTPGATVTFSQNHVILIAGEGRRDAARALDSGLHGRVELTTDVVGEGQWAVAGYADAATTGVLIVRVVDGKFARLWITVDGSW